jgi:hypothetical protein
MYIFAKFLADYIFLQNHDKINIKKNPQTHDTAASNCCATDTAQWVSGLTRQHLGARHGGSTPYMFVVLQKKNGCFFNFEGIV